MSTLFLVSLSISGVIALLLVGFWIASFYLDILPIELYLLDKLGYRQSGVFAIKNNRKFPWIYLSLSIVALGFLPILFWAIKWFFWIITLGAIGWVVHKVFKAKRMS